MDFYKCFVKGRIGGTIQKGQAVPSRREAENYEYGHSFCGEKKIIELPLNVALEDQVSQLFCCSIKQPQCCCCACSVRKYKPDRQKRCSCKYKEKMPLETIFLQYLKKKTCNYTTYLFGNVCEAFCTFNPRFNKFVRVSKPPSCENVS